MAAIRPFRAIRYNQAKVGDLSSVVAPPYDVISPEQQDALHLKSPYNVVRLILGKDTSAEDKYDRAGNLWRAWQEEGVLLRDEQPAVYLYRQEFELEGKRLARGGFVAAVRLEDLSSGAVFPHEQTMASPREDRMRIMKACHANLSPVFALFDDPSREILDLLAGLDLPAEMEAAGDQGVKSAVSPVRDAKSIVRLSSLLAPKELYIADGHHRYETALAYRELRRQERGGGDAPFDYIMMLCVAIEDPGLRILPAHRVLRGLDSKVLRDFQRRIPRYFDVQELPLDKGLEYGLELLSRNHKPSTFLVYGVSRPRYLLLKLRDQHAMDSLLPKRSLEWRQLDVSVLHTLVIQEALGLQPDEVSKGEKIAYIRDPEQVLRLVNSGAYQLAILHNQTRVEQLKQVAAQGERMPPKSTYFYPKPLSGLLMNSLESF